MAEPNPNTPQSGVGPYPAGVATPGSNKVPPSAGLIVQANGSVVGPALDGGLTGPVTSVNFSSDFDVIEDPADTSGLTTKVSRHINKQVIAGDGAITIQTGSVYLTKGSAAAITLAAPTAVTHDGIRIRVINVSGFAHVVTCPTNSIKDGSSTTKDTATFAAHAGGVFEVEAYNGAWYAVVASTVAPAVLTEV